MAGGQMQLGGFAALERQVGQVGGDPQRGGGPQDADQPRKHRQGDEQREHEKKDAACGKGHGQQHQKQAEGKEQMDSHTRKGTVVFCSRDRSTCSG